MRLINVSKRIKILSRLIDNCQIFYDIGCDHGQLGYLLLEQNTTSKVVFCDISEKCLNKSRCSMFGIFNDRKSFYLGDGIPDNVINSSIGIMGLGGVLISKILTKDTSINSVYYLQPTTNVVFLRKYLVKNFYEIIKDEIIEVDFKFYSIIVVRKGEKKQNLSECEIYFGMGAEYNQNDIFKRYIEKRENICLRTLANLDINMIKYKMKNKVENENEREYYYLTLLKKEQL